MAREDPKQPDPDRMIQTYTEVERPPLHQLLLNISAAVGFIIGAGLVFVIGSALIMDSHENKPANAGTVGIVAIVVSTVSIICVYAIAHRRRRRPAESRSSVLPYVAIGFLIGCGIACLLEGLCYTVVINHL